MYEVKVTDNQISWLQPDQFRLAEQFNRRMAIRKHSTVWAVAFIIAVFAPAFISVVANTRPHPSLVLIGWVAFSSLLLFSWLALHNVSPTRDSRLKVNTKKLGVVKWRDVNWWRLVTDDRFDLLHVLEAEVTWFFGKKTLVRR